MAVRAGDRRGSECCSVMGQISVASVLSTTSPTAKAGRLPRGAAHERTRLIGLGDKADDDSQNCWCGLQRSGGMVCH